MGGKVGLFYPRRDIHLGPSSNEWLTLDQLDILNNSVHLNFALGDVFVCAAS